MTRKKPIEREKNTNTLEESKLDKENKIAIKIKQAMKDKKNILYKFTTWPTEMSAAA